MFLKNNVNNALSCCSSLSTMATILGDRPDPGITEMDVDKSPATKASPWLQKLNGLQKAQVGLATNGANANDRKTVLTMVRPYIKQQVCMKMFFVG